MDTDNSPPPHLVCGKLELVPRQRVAETQTHRSEVVVSHRREQAVHLPPDAAHELHHRRVVHALDRQLILDGVRELGVSDGQLKHAQPKHVFRGTHERGAEGGKREESGNQRGTKVDRIGWWL